ncbi:unnamed protein product [Oppiella nova]|uniref:procollagen-proline 4-dioxygenase n=1 Tax=Oppiella nova TaxID=334625 RepID=A0A7R9M6T9_9ACAR|nr:unnamed protein product [Oppiella nova]CAG2171722.1 unnamed protein product [Oppiella nova]
MSSDGLNRRKRTVNRNGDTNEGNVCRVVSREVSPERPQNQSIMKRVMSGMTLSMAILAMVYYTTQCNDTKELVMASANQSIKDFPIRRQVMCSQDYDEERVRFPSCTPQRCGRFVSDSVITEPEAKHLLLVAKRGLSLGGSSGGVTRLNVDTGLLSIATNFVNIYKLIERTQRMDEHLKELFTEKDLQVYRTVKNKIRKRIAIHFGVPSAQLYFTRTSSFLRMTSKRPQIKADVYWRRHVDKREVKCLRFTSLLYLSTYGADFSGGRFIFTDEMSNQTIEPKFGRVAAFTSGSENEHFVERVTSGARYSLLIGFTSDPKFAVKYLQVNLLTQEKAMIESLSEYLVSEDVLNSRLRRLTDNSLSLNSIALKDDTEGLLLGHPLDVYLLIRRMAIDWKEVKDLLRTKDQRLSDVQMRQIGGHSNHTNALKFDSQCVSSSHEIITNKELKDAAYGVISLINTYDLDIKSLANGFIRSKTSSGAEVTSNGNQSKYALNAFDCYLIGKQTFDNKEYSDAKQWLTEAIDRLDDMTSDEIIADIFNYLSFCELKSGKISGAQKYKRLSAAIKIKPPNMIPIAMGSTDVVPVMKLALELDCLN